jgi:dienelactone hydrolase
VAFLASSCGSGNGNSADGVSSPDSSSAAAAAVFDSSLLKGVVTDNINCKKQGNQTYALYLPSYYTTKQKFPCIFFFDAHARGAFPLRKYKELAEKYGFVMAGSNISKNGMSWSSTDDVVKTLMADVLSRVNVDGKRIYTSGFSGGSRVASSVALLDGGIAGVIGCASGFPQNGNEGQNKFDYAGIVGDYDFNVIDMEKLDEALEKNSFNHQLLEFEGKHEWPPMREFNTAMLWMQVNAMKENLQTKNDSIITALKNDYEKRISEAKSSGNVVKEEKLLNGFVKTLDGLSDVSSFKKQLTDMSASPAFKSEEAAHEQLLQNEINYQQELSKDTRDKDEKWWEGKIAELNKNVHKAKTKQESEMYQRLLNFCGLLLYLNASHAISVGDLTNAESYIKVFKMADPKNPDCYYLGAVLSVKKGNTQEAISSLNKAAQLGFNDLPQLLYDATLGRLQSEAGFKDIVEKIKQNSIPQ